ncbi:ArsR/SmtB family transcription factor [Methanobacterium alcaliphilum]|uniref:ArsR/SmtB family transcription factor n=1 Tax=Methanobacterium alcaliphilum TaxID=392018 RepID=UPI00200B3ED2|nr:ArsR family transcriptional regulator [Methanobacterium alcaliphilum]MCK9152282.1 helix-turn-helix domain-containing protein [Methanobacterium alcaliphilum]
MDKKNDLNPSQEFLLKSFDEIVPILKALGNPSRLTILILLVNGPVSFQTLLDELKLKKSALANHLTQLKNTGLIEKKQHGTYNITEDGKRYVFSIEKSFKDSEKVETRRKEMEQRKNLAKSFLERK